MESSVIYRVGLAAGLSPRRHRWVAMVIVSGFVAASVSLAPRVSAAQTYPQTYVYPQQYNDYQQQYAEWYARYYGGRGSRRFALDSYWPVSIRFAGTGPAWTSVSGGESEGHVVASIGLRITKYLRRNFVRSDPFVILIPELGYNFIFGWSEEHYGFAGLRAGLGDEIVEGTVGFSFMYGGDSVLLRPGFTLSIGMSVWHSVFGVELAYIWRADPDVLLGQHSIRYTFYLDLIEVFKIWGDSDTPIIFAG